MLEAPALSQVYTDFSGLTALKARAREDQDGALDQVTRQFESLFLQMMLKSMRDASPGGGILDSKQTEFYRDMYDQQLSVHLSERQGIGLADVLKRQLGGAAQAAGKAMSPEEYRLRPISAAPRNAAPVNTRSAPVRAADAVTDIGASREDFVRALWPVAQAAGEQLDLPPEALLAQAALETGWGRHVMQRAGGRSAHNLFGIKADQRWDGARVNRQTLEYVQGAAVKTRAQFRAYESYDESFRDYVGFVRDNPRYQDALHNSEPAAYFSALQEAGYATDPAYAEKIMRIIEGPDMQAVLGQLRAADTGGGDAG